MEISMGIADHIVCALSYTISGELPKHSLIMSVIQVCKKLDDRDLTYDEVDAVINHMMFHGVLFINANGNVEINYEK